MLDTQKCASGFLDSAHQGNTLNVYAHKKELKESYSVNKKLPQGIMQSINTILYYLGYPYPILPLSILSYQYSILTQSSKTAPDDF